MGIRQANFWLGVWAVAATGGIFVASPVHAVEESDAPRPLADAKAIHTALAKIVSLDWKDVSLADAATQVESLSGVRVFLDHRALEDAGASADTKVNCVVRDLPLRAALTHAFKPLDLACMPKENFLLFTTPEKASSEEVVRVYEVLDLLAPNDDISSESLDYDLLIELISTIVQPTTWDAVGWPSTMLSVGPGCLTIRQTDEVHEQIAQLLTALRRAKAEGAKQNYQAIPAEDSYLAELHASFEKILNSPHESETDQVSLADALAALRAQTTLNVLVDQRALADSGTSLDTPLTGDYSGISLHLALELMLSPHELKAEISQGVLLVTTAERADTNIVNVVYPVDDLIAKLNVEADVSGCGRRVEGEMWCRVVTGGKAYVCSQGSCQMYGGAIRDTDTLIKAVTTSIAPQSWDQVGGMGSIAPFDSCLVVSQTPENHRLISNWLRDLRQVLREREKAGTAMPKASTALVTQVFTQPKTKEAPLSYADQRETALEAIALVTSTIDTENWKEGSDRYIVPVGSSIVVRQDPATLRKVDALLMRLGFQPASFGGGAFYTMVWGAGWEVEEVLLRRARGNSCVLAVIEVLNGAWC